MVMIRLTEEGRGCVSCGSKRFYLQGFGMDGGCGTWLDAQCVDCRKDHGLWEPVEYTKIWSEDELRHEVDVAMNLMEQHLIRQKITPYSKALKEAHQLIEDCILYKYS